MLVPDPLAEVAAEWVGKAENDLKNATHALKLGEGGPTDTVCFHAQQCIEKYLKALLVITGSGFPKTHNIRVLVDFLPARLRPNITLETQNRLTEYATVTRYPGDYDPIPVAEARQAVKTARQVRSSIRKFLPRKATRARGGR